MNSLTQFKQAIHSLNEKITDIDAFQKNLTQLGTEYKHNPTVISFLKMMHALGNYLDLKKDTAHADSIPALNSIAACLEKVITDKNLNKDDLNRILSGEIQKYKSLQNKIASRPVITDKEMNNLKAVILAIDWEISDTTLRNFETVVKDFMAKLNHYIIHHTFLKIIYNTGQYIGIQKANAHTDSISFLRSVFENFEQIVQTPDMSFKDKKQILETEINRFHQFKIKIFQKKNKTYATADIQENETVQPALSHIKKTAAAPSGELVPLTTLPDQEDVSESIAPAFSNKKSSAGPRDIMDDLFSMKVSPADELLDEIHLYNVHGSKTINRSDQTKDSLSAGVKNFTPQLADNDPIPEIGNRLDEFFNLETPLDTPARQDSSGLQPIEILNAEDQGPADSIVPFQQEDDAFDETLNEIDFDEPIPQNPDLDILSKLKIRIQDLEWLQDRTLLLSMNQDISNLKNRWQNDPEKTCLLEIIATAIDHLKKQSKTLQQKNGSRSDNNTGAISDTMDKKNIGFWGKIKSKFTN